LKDPIRVVKIGQHEDGRGTGILEQLIDDVEEPDITEPDTGYGSISTP